MDVRCDKCQARYRIDDARVGPSGLTMRCGKCGNTFKVTKDSAAGASAPPPAAPASKPAPAAAAKAAEPAPNATMVFGQAPVLPKPAPKPAPAPAGDGAGSTMMFGQSPVAPAVAAAALGKPKPAPAAAKPPDDSGSTMVFGAAPVLPKPAPTAMPKATSSAGKPAPAPAMVDGAGSTMMFGQSPIAAKPPAPPAPKPPPPAPPPPAPAPAPVAEAPAEEHSPEATVEATDDEIPTSHSQSSVPAAAAKVEIPAEEQAAGHDEATKPGKKPQAEPAVAAPGESVGEDPIDASAMTAESQEAPAEAEAPAEEESALSKGPSKKLMMILGGVAAAIFLILGGLVAKKALGHKPPPEAAVQALEQGRALLEKDSLATFPSALETTVAAIEAAPKSPFGEAHAIKAEIEITWSEALTEQSALLEDKAQRADDDKAKAEATAASEKAKVDAKTHLKAGLEATQAGFKADPKSPDVAVALLDYYRVTKSERNFRQQLKKAAELKADEGKIALVEALKLLADDDGAEKALPKLKAAAASYPGSARVQYRIAKAYLALKNDAEALKALQETVKLSGSHERAQAALNDLQANAPPAETPPAPAEPEKK
jgi:predicted Zn finger-like uncharacterized protein